VIYVIIIVRLFKVSYGLRMQKKETGLLLQYVDSFVDCWVSGVLGAFQTIMKGSLNNLNKQTLWTIF
jgi:hypothetical protein